MPRKRAEYRLTPAAERDLEGLALLHANFFDFTRFGPQSIGLITLIKPAMQILPLRPCRRDARELHMAVAANAVRDARDLYCNRQARR